MRRQSVPLGALELLLRFLLLLVCCASGHFLEQAGSTLTFAQTLECLDSSDVALHVFVYYI